MRISSGNQMGTGFVVGVPSERHRGEYWRYIVTADHVTRHQIEVRVETADPFTGNMRPPALVEEWHQPLAGVDLAITPYHLDGEVNVIQLDKAALPPGLIPAPGATIYYVGIFEPAGVPMVRGGTFGAPRHRYTDDGYDFAASLIDCRTYFGFSGSPCFAETELMAVRNREVEPMLPVSDDFNPEKEPLKFSPLWCTTPLMGILIAHYDDSGAKTNPERAASRLGVGVIVPMPYIWEAFATDLVRDNMREADEKLQKEKDEGAKTEPVAARTGDGSNPEFERFEALTRQLAHTPKPKDE